MGGGSDMGDNSPDHRLLAEEPPMVDAIRSKPTAAQPLWALNPVWGIGAVSPPTRSARHEEQPEYSVARMTNVLPKLHSFHDGINSFGFSGDEDS